MTDTDRKAIIRREAAHELATALCRIMNKHGVEFCTHSPENGILVFLPEDVELDDLTSVAVEVTVNAPHRLE